MTIFYFIMCALIIRYTTASHHTRFIFYDLSAFFFTNATEYETMCIHV